MDGIIGTCLGCPGEGFRLCLQNGPTPLLDLLRTVSQLGEEVPQLLPHHGFRAQAQVRGDLFARPVPDRLVSIEIRAISRQAHQSQSQAGSSQAGVAK